MIDYLGLRGPGTRRDWNKGPGVVGVTRIGDAGIRITWTGRSVN